MNIIAEEGQRIVFSSSVLSPTPVEYRWLHEGKPVPEDYAHEFGSEGSTLVMPSVELPHKGTYTLEVCNEAGKISKNVVLDVVLNFTDMAASPPAVQAILGDSAWVPDCGYSDPIPISEFGDYVRRGHANSNEKFVSEFKVSVQDVFE